MEALELSTVEEPQPQPERPGVRALKVIVLLVITAGVFSYLGAFALTDALARANMIRPLSHDHDPRLKWAAISFVGILVSFGGIGLLIRFLGVRPSRKLEQPDATDENDQ